MLISLVVVSVSWSEGGRVRLPWSRKAATSEPPQDTGVLWRSRDSRESIQVFIGALITLGHTLMVRLRSDDRWAHSHWLRISRRSEPLVGPLVLNDEQCPGQKVFMKQCSQSHPPGDAGLGPALNDKPLPAFLIRRQVLQRFGALPAFSEARVADPELADVIAYLQALRGHG